MMAKFYKTLQDNNLDSDETQKFPVLKVNWSPALYKA